MDILIPDMDDVSLDNPDANGLNYAFYLKGKFPKFKITLFCIPGRSSLEWLEELSKLDWIEVAIHGNNHDENEEITQRVINDWPILYDKDLYKGPNWKVTEKEKKVLEKNGYIVVTKEWTLNTKGVVHGHCWIKGDWLYLESLITPTTEFKFISEFINET